MFTSEQTGALEQFSTPFYYYNIDLLRDTLNELHNQSLKSSYTIHYAIKANANHRILKEIASFGFGADCVSGNEIKLAIECGFNSQKIVFAGVGKTDPEIEFALDRNIFCFHCESVQELIVINQLAEQRSIVARVALRLNPNVKANTHSHITTGLIENKFGLSIEEVLEAKRILPELKNIQLIGLHFHIGSQITDMEVFINLTDKATLLEQKLFPNNQFSYINFGGGLGIDYANPTANPIPDFKSYLSIFRDRLKSNSKRKVHFELGRSIVGQCGCLVTRVTYVKGSSNHHFVVVDAGMNDLIRPALYGASHSIINLSSNKKTQMYDVVGPVCESADCFAKNILLPAVQRGDMFAILSSGAYGEVMSSTYNMREIPYAVYSDKINEIVEVIKE